MKQTMHFLQYGLISYSCIGKIFLLILEYIKKHKKEKNQQEKLKNKKNWKNRMKSCQIQNRNNFKLLKKQTFGPFQVL